MDRFNKKVSRIVTSLKGNVLANVYVQHCHKKKKLTCYISQDWSVCMRATCSANQYPGIQPTLLLPYY